MLPNKFKEKTVYSLSEKTPERPDRRSDERYVSLLRVGALTIEGRRELCLIRNVSAGGMMIRPYSPIEVETHLRIELKQGDPVSGIVQWADKGLVGVTFDEPIDVLALLNAASEQPKPRMPRIEIDCTASLRYNEFVFRADVANISQGGICVNSPVDLEPDSDVVVTIAGLRPTAGIVKWQEGELFGIGFNRVYAVSELMTFLQQQQRNERQRRATA